MAEKRQTASESGVGCNRLLGGLFEFVCENLPDDWVLRIDSRSGEASIELIDPDGKRVEICDDDLTDNEMIVERVNHARRADGLQEIEREMY